MRQNLQALLYDGKAYPNLSERACRISLFEQNESMQSLPRTKKHIP